MADEEQKEIFAKNLNRFLELNNKTQKEVADAIGVIPSTFNTWCQGIALPRMGKVQALADYFGINKSDLIDKNNECLSKENSKNSIDAIAQDLQNAIDKLNSGASAPEAFEGIMLTPEIQDFFTEQLNTMLKYLKELNKGK